MAQTPGSNSESWRTSLTFAKILLRKYGILHEFHVIQLQNYPIACCKISLDGTIEIDADRKLVKYDIKTKRFFKKKAKTESKESEIVPRALNSFFGKWEIKEAQYKEECEMARNNLTLWTKELLWGVDETQVKVVIDGREIE